MGESIHIDLKKQILISKEMENVIKKHLSDKYSKNDVELFWEMIIQQYAAFIKDLPDFGGKKSREAKEHPRKTDNDGYWYND